MGNVEQKNNIDIINTEYIIDNKIGNLKRDSKIYQNNKQAIGIVKNYEIEFEKIGYGYDIDIAVDTITGKYYLIFGKKGVNKNKLAQNALDIGLDINELDSFLNILLIGFQGKPIMEKKELKKYDISKKSKIGNFIREVSGEKFLDPLYNKPADGGTPKSKIEKNIEKKVRKVEIIESKSDDGYSSGVLKFGENISFTLYDEFSSGYIVIFNKKNLIKTTKNFIEGKKSIKDIKEGDIMDLMEMEKYINKLKNKNDKETEKGRLTKQKTDTLERYKKFIDACLEVKEGSSFYPGSYGIPE